MVWQVDLESCSKIQKRQKIIRYLNIYPPNKIKTVIVILNEIDRVKI